MSDRRRLVRKSESVPSASASPVNLITNPSFETGVTGWSVNTGTLIQDAGSANVGNYGAKFTGTVVSNDGSMYSPAFPVSVGDAYSARCFLYVTNPFNGSNPGLMSIQWDDGSAAFTLGSANGPSTGGGIGSRTLTITAAVAPASATQARLRLVGTTTGSDSWDWSVDSVSCVKALTATYFDGDTPGYGWLGVPHASTSAPLVTTVRDYENGSTYQSVRGSFIITPGQRQPTWANSQRRYGGKKQTGETHDNGTIGWTIMAKGSTLDDSLVVVEALLGDLESMVASYADTYVEWRPDGATHSTYYEVRGPASWQPNYEWARFVGTGAIPIDVRIPVAPIADVDSYQVLIAATTLPATIQLGAAVTGTAPARALISLTTSGGSAAPIWALLAWLKRPGSPAVSGVAPFGVIEAETGANLSTWSVVSDANYRGSSGIRATTSGAGTAAVDFAVDPSVMTGDDFTPGEVSVEVWGRIELASTVVSPRLIVSLRPAAGASFGGEQFSEWGSTGRLVTLPSSGTRFRFVRLGTLNLPIDMAQPLSQYVHVVASWATGSSGAFGLDYTVLVPARQRALSASGKPNDSAYAKFIAGTGATTKTIRSDLSGRVASGSGNPGRDSGLGGQLIALPPGNVDLFAKLSSLVADDPTVDATSEQLAHSSVTGWVRITPRVFLAG